VNQLGLYLWAVHADFQAGPNAVALVLGIRPV